MIATRYGDGPVHVWHVTCAGPLPRLDLPDDELRAAERFVSEVHRRRYLLQRVALRTLLARYVTSVQFARGPRGKPWLEGVEFSLSHADDQMLLAVSRELAVGVDLERLAADLDPAALGKLVLAPDESAPDKRAFLRIWCRKEAVLKAAGVGLLDDLTSLSVTGDHLRFAGASYFLQDLDFIDAHAAALATAAGCAKIPAAALEQLEIP